MSSRNPTSNNEDGTLIIIPWVHQMQHEGRTFFVKAWLDVADAATQFNFCLTVPATVECHAVWDVAAESEFTMSVYEGATTSGGSAAAIYNTKRSGGASACTAVTAPTVSGTGTEIWSAVIGSAKNATELRSQAYELILKPSTKYLMRAVHVPAGTHWLDYNLSWYEEPV